MEQRAVNEAHIAELCQKETQLLLELEQVRNELDSIKSPGFQLNIEKTCNTAADVANKPFKFFHTPIVFAFNKSV